MYATQRAIPFKLCFCFFIVLILFKLLVLENYLEQLFQYSKPGETTVKQGIETTGQWTQGDDGGAVFFFSAYMDVDRILLISLIKFTFSNSIRCRYFNRNGTQLPFLFDGHIHMLKEWQDRWYRPSFVYCRLTNMDMLPYGVALVSDATNLPINFVPIQYAKNVKRNFTVCISPMHNNFNNGQELVEMIELNRILGADFFIIYNLSSSQNIKGILNHYQAQGFVEIVQWNLPSKITVFDWFAFREGINYYGQVAALNDCVYRNKGVSHYVVNQDMDEFIIPRNFLTWNQLMSDIQKGFGSFMFRSTVFPNDWPDVPIGEDARDALKFGSKTVLKQLRESVVLTHEERTKWIVKPECIVSCATHDVRKTIANESCRNYNVPKDKAIVNHYRNKQFARNHKQRVLDSRINIYKSELMKRLKNKWNVMKQFII